MAGLHLWYLIDDLDALHLLLAYGVTTWGQLENLVACGGEQVLADHPQVLERARCLARAVDVMHERAAIGRGHAVDRAALLASGAVSERKMEELCQVAARCGGRASLLLAALEQKEVQGFGDKKIGDLRDYLAREGFLDEAQPMSAQEIRLAMIAGAVDDVRSGTLGQGAVDALLGRIRSRTSATGGVLSEDVPTLPFATLATPANGPSA